MNSNDSRTRGRKQGRGGRRPNRNPNKQGARPPREERSAPAEKLSFWRKLLSFLTGGGSRVKTEATVAEGDRRPGGKRAPRPVEKVEVTSPKIYVGNLSYEATESDLFDVFNGVGTVQDAEIVSDAETYRSKGFGFVTMARVEEAKRAVDTLHDKDFMGRRMVVTGVKSEQQSV